MKEAESEESQPQSEKVGFLCRAGNRTDRINNRLSNSIRKIDKKCWRLDPTCAGSRLFFLAIHTVTLMISKQSSGKSENANKRRWRRRGRYHISATFLIICLHVSPYHHHRINFKIIWYIYIYNSRCLLRITKELVPNLQHPFPFGDCTLIHSPFFSSFSLFLLYLFFLKF